MVLFTGFFLMPLYSQENLLKNPSFEEIDPAFPGESIPTGWTFYGNPGTVIYTASEEHPYQGKRACHISNAAPHHSVLEQKVTVKGLSVYYISGWLRTGNIGENASGAGISVNDNWEVAGDFTGTHDEWEFIDMYIVTGPRVSSLTVKLNIGIFASENTGDAWFDDLSMIKTDYLPDSVLLSTVDPDAKSLEPEGVIIWTQDDILHPKVTLDGLPLVLLILIAVLIISGLLYYLYLNMNAGTGPLSGK